MKTESKAVEIKARTRHLQCYIHEWERQKEKPNVKSV